VTAEKIGVRKTLAPAQALWKPCKPRLWRWKQERPSRRDPEKIGVRKTLAPAQALWKRRLSGAPHSGKNPGPG